MKAVVLTSGLTFVGMHIVYGGGVVSASALLIDMLLTGAGVGATRFGFRALRQYILHKQNEGERVALYGTGRGDVLALRSLDLFERDFHVVGVVEDRGRRHGERLKGLPVFDTLENLGHVVEQQRLDGVVVNTATHTTAEVDEIRRQCRAQDRACYCVDIRLREHRLSLSAQEDRMVAKV